MKKRYVFLLSVYLVFGGMISTSYEHEYVLNPCYGVDDSAAIRGLVITIGWIPLALAGMIIRKIDPPATMEECFQ
jgi:hypothetical protein